MESQPGYHATGRSVAFWAEIYCGPAIQPLTTASGSLMRTPDPSFSETPFLHARGSTHIGREASASASMEFTDKFERSSVPFTPIDINALWPSLRDPLTCWKCRGVD